MDRDTDTVEGTVVGGEVPGATVGSFEVGGARLVYEEYGAGDRVFVYLHGLLMDSQMNRALARALAALGLPRKKSRSGRPSRTART